MYRLFSAGIRNYFAMNQGAETERLRVAEPLLLLAEQARYREERQKGSDLYLRTLLLLQAVEACGEQGGAMATIAYELWAMGYDGADLPLFPEERLKKASVAAELEEQMKLVKLFVTSTAYWPE